MNPFQQQSDKTGNQGTNSSSLNETTTARADGACPDAFEGQRLPSPEITQEAIERAKLLVERTVLGVSYRTALTNIAQQPWEFTNRYNLEEHQLTAKLIKLNPTLEAEYMKRIHSEGIFHTLLTLIPIIGPTPPGVEYLKSQVEINQILKDLLQAGLATIKETPGKFVEGSPLYGGFQTLSRWKISASDLGRLTVES